LFVYLVIICYPITLSFALNKAKPGSRLRHKTFSVKLIFRLVVFIIVYIKMLFSLFVYLLFL